MCRYSAHRPFSCPMSTVLSCFMGDYQSVVFWVACPSALFLSDVHGVRYGDSSIVGVWLFMGWVYLSWTKHATPCSRAVKGWGYQVKAAGAVRLNGKGWLGWTKIYKHRTPWTAIVRPHSQDILYTQIYRIWKGWREPERQCTRSADMKNDD